MNVCDNPEEDPSSSPSSPLPPPLPPLPPPSSSPPPIGIDHPINDPVIPIDNPIIIKSRPSSSHRNSRNKSLSTNRSNGKNGGGGGGGGGEGEAGDHIEMERTLSLHANDNAFAPQTNVNTSSHVEEDKNHNNHNNNNSNNNNINSTKNTTTTNNNNNHPNNASARHFPRHSLPSLLDPSAEARHQALKDEALILIHSMVDHKTSMKGSVKVGRHHHHHHNNNNNAVIAPAPLDSSIPHTNSLPPTSSPPSTDRINDDNDRINEPPSAPSIAEVIGGDHRKVFSSGALKLMEEFASRRKQPMIIIDGEGTEGGIGTGGGGRGEEKEGKMDDGIGKGSLSHQLGSLRNKWAAVHDSPKGSLNLPTPSIISPSTTPRPSPSISPFPPLPPKPSDIPLPPTTPTTTRASLTGGDAATEARARALLGRVVNVFKQTKDEKIDEKNIVEKALGRHYENTFFLLPRSFFLRKITQWIIDNYFFRLFIMIAIFANCIFLAMDQPNVDKQSPFAHALETGEDVFAW